MIHPASFIPRLTLLAGCLLVSACAREFSGWLPPVGWLPGWALLGALLVRHLKPIAPAEEPPEQSRDLNLDIGQTVTVEAWEQSGLARISYRGTIWQAELLSGYPRRIGTHRIHAIAGSRLVLIPVELARATGSAPAPVAVG